MNLRYLIYFFSFLFSFSLSAKTALIFGITGQDGAYLTEFLLDKGYTVHGVKRRSSSPNTSRVDRFYEDIHKATRFFLHYGDVTDGANVLSLVQTIQPDEIYNLAAQSHVRVSFEMPEYTAEVDGMGTLHILEAIRTAGLIEKTRFYQASTSELFGKVQEIPQKETTPFYPRSPYGVAKLYGYWATVQYREAYNLFACNGILFNHESPFRGETFVSRKITLAAARYHAGLSKDPLYLGNLEAKRDWGYAKDYVEAMWLMLQQEIPQDYVIATGKTYSVRQFVEMAYQALGTKVIWQGEGLDEVGINADTGEIIVKIDPRYFRPTEVDLLLGDATKAEKELGWTSKTSLEELVQLMIDADYKLALQEKRMLSLDESIR